ncbi:glycoside hydrolase family 2 protein [Annulohypoxylon maeteangense]|uniref:glycoside hydrolase family 2 protein n=1 Tax=Annulohypoxylon maeteangense TaxID=1927788 RepID=UPI002008517B|nr:glycoside hydrolase family 2 protein [Annulohypoxylon maeteangense]KAI0880698.1 glycoside hydrolase family 2 protein [Annulohypoxylon maeteangense]
MRTNLFTSLLTLIPMLGNLALGYEVQTPPLDTDWTYSVGTDPWPEYPRPQLQRSQWQSLNGIWKWKTASYPGEALPESHSFQQDIMVPSCIESALSGVMKMNQTYSWYSTGFHVPHGYVQNGHRVLLNFEAVDHQATVYVNGELVGTHTGGYWHFNFDITKYLTSNGENTLHVFVFDPTDAQGYMNPVGKQTRTPSHIFYTPCTGIWQTVWLESVPESHITQLDVVADMSGQVNVTVGTSCKGSDPVVISVIDSDGKVVGSGKGIANQAFDFVVKSPDLWSPDSPTLYNLTVKLGDDIVNSYTGFRTFSIGEVEGVKRPLINGEFIFQFGTLDQGFWPDGIYTPPNREAMVYDLKVLKDLGLNMLRKHIKVENALFYQACDQLGLLLIQDMPSMPLRKPDADQQADWERQLDILVKQHRNYPSIYTWVIYNEGWGQISDDYYPEFNITTRVKELDPTRFVDATTGWNDHGAGDWHDNHHYANPQCGTPFYSIASTPYDNQRIAIQGEFGGIGHNVSADHLWKVKDAFLSINQTYEIDLDLDAYNYRGHLLLSELRDQIERYACSAAVWTQTTDVEGEVNGFLTYDRRIQRTDKNQWRSDIEALYDAAATRGGKAPKRRMAL